MKLSERIRVFRYSEDTRDDLVRIAKQLEAENAAAFELLDVYEKENERLRNYAAHRIGCETWEGKSCDCGLLKEGE